MGLGISRAVKPDGLIRLLEYTRPTGAVRIAITKIWEPWVYWAYGAGFDRRTEEYIPKAGLELVDSQFVSGDIIKMITARPLPQSN